MKSSNINTADQQKFFIELPNSIELFAISGWTNIQDNIKSIKELNQRTNKLEDLLKSDPNFYNLMIAGLFYGMQNDNFMEYSEYLFIINKDNHDYLIKFLIEYISECHTKFTSKNILNLTKLFDKLFMMSNPFLSELVLTFIRIFYCGSWVIDNIEIYRIILQFIKNKINWIIFSSQTANLNLIPIVFLKILRMITENSILVNDNRLNFAEILNDELYIITSLWEAKKDDVLLAGRELFRQIISVAKCKIPQLLKIFEEISKSQTINNQPLYVNLLNTPHSHDGFSYYTLVMIPPYLEKMIRFVLFQVPKNQYTWYMNLIFKTFKLTTCEADMTLFIDLTRYLVTNYELNLREYTTPRWIILGNILKNIKNELINGEVKQALFFDWLFYNKERESILLLEPGIMIIYWSSKNFSEITMELIDFLDLYSKNFDSHMKKEIKNNIISAFREFEKLQIIQSYDYILKEEKINEEIKKIFINLCDLKEIEKENLIITEKNQRNTNNNLLNCNNLDINISNQNILNNCLLDSDDSDNEENKNLDNPYFAQDKIQENKKQIKKTTMDVEFYIHQSLSDLILPSILNNFINYRSKKTFFELLENFLSNFLLKLKSKNLLESKLALIDQEVSDIYLHFATFYIKIFKDELELNSVLKFFNLDEFTINPINSNITNQKNNLSQTEIKKINTQKKENTLTCHSLIDFFIIKFKNKIDKEISILSEIINKILDLYPKFIIRLFGFFIKRFHNMKIKRANDLKIDNFNTLYNNNGNPDRVFVEMLQKLFKDNNEYLKIRLRLLFEICYHEGELEFLNIFLQKGLSFFSHIITDDQEFITKILSYSSFETINSISINMQSLSNNNLFNFSIFNNPEKISKIIEISVDLTSFEQEKLWILINSIRNLNKIFSLKDFISHITKYLTYLKTKQENNYNFVNCKNIIFKNFISVIRLNYINDLVLVNENIEKKMNDFILLLEIPYCFSEELYDVFRLFSSFITKLPEYFYFLIEEFIKKYDLEINRNFYLDNLLRHIKDFIFYEKYNLNPILFDQNNYTVKFLINKIDSLAKIFQIELDK